MSLRKEAERLAGSHPSGAPCALGHLSRTVRDDGIGFEPGQAEERFGVSMRVAPGGPDTPEGLGLVVV